MITLDKFIDNIDNFSMKNIEQEIIDLFEPILYQIILFTRPDTGRARRELGEKFFNETNPTKKRILRALHNDIGYHSGMYYYWNKKGSDRDTENNSVFNKIVEKKKLFISIESMDEGLIRQAINGDLASERVPKRKNSVSRFPPRHIYLVGDLINNTGDLSQISNSQIESYISKNIQVETEKIIKKISRELFKG